MVPFISEEGWLAYSEPEFVWRQFERLTALSRRKSRLFAVAAIRLVAQWFIDPVQVVALGIAERYADGAASDEELVRVNRQVDEYAEKLFWTCDNGHGSEGLQPDEFENLGIPRTASTERLGTLCGLWAATGAAIAVACVTRTDWPKLLSSCWHGPHPAVSVVDEVTKVSASEQLLRVFGDVDPADDPVHGAEYNSALAFMKGRLATLFREISGNPYRPVVLDPGWATATVLALSHGIYDAGDFTPLPILADALEDAGCADEQVLGHCRSAGVHVRGCWVLDLLLGKE
jgi:hypothetical protein